MENVDPMATVSGDVTRLGEERVLQPSARVNQEEEGPRGSKRKRREEQELRRVQKGPAKRPSTRRNERERNRVRVINSTFGVLQSYLPEQFAHDKKNQKLSKLDILRSAIEYIHCLHDVLKEDQIMDYRGAPPVTSSPESDTEGHRLTNQSGAYIGGASSPYVTAPYTVTYSSPPSELPPASAMLQHRLAAAHAQYSPEDWSPDADNLPYPGHVIEARSDVDDSKVTLTPLDKGAPDVNVNFRCFDATLPRFTSPFSSADTGVFSVNSLLS